MTNFKYGRAICYSGYRDGQGPNWNIHPNYDEVKEDLIILSEHFDYIRMYSPGYHTQTAIKVIEDLNLDLKVMLGVHLQGEESNPLCTWGGDYTDEQVEKHKIQNSNQVKEAIKIANLYPEIVFSVSAGNEAVPVWNENLVRAPKVLEFVKELKANIKQPVTYCDGGHEWTSTLKEVAKEVDFISVHTYAVWNEFNIDEGLKIANRDLKAVNDMYPNKKCIITETGWPTQSDGKRIKPELVGEDIQLRYFNEIEKWSKDSDTLMFFFASFDSKWKGGAHPLDPEKNWGVYNSDRTPKKVIKNLILKNKHS